MQQSKEILQVRQQLGSKLVVLFGILRLQLFFQNNPSQLGMEQCPKHTAPTIYYN